MPVYAVTYDHPDEDGWKRHVMPHVMWLQDRLRDGSLIASGPFTGTTVKSALLIMSAPDRSAIEGLIASDPFATEGLIEKLVIHEWDPIFGVFNDRPSLPGQMQGLIVGTHRADGEAAGVTSDGGR